MGALQVHKLVAEARDEERGAKSTLKRVPVSLARPPRPVAHEVIGGGTRAVLKAGPTEGCG